ncbi:MAG TPA: LPS export ABC transporter periplasmic protein LptC [Thermodesulfobacteriota bacterium]|nr:LPS export ABC transporter periplasmic protein LptC [Thermodesulfobacteriota bacterium]
MKKGFRLFLFLLTGLLLSGLLFVSLRFNKDFGKTVSVASRTSITKVQYSGIRDNRREWELTADSATQLKDRAVMVLKNVKLTYYTEQGLSYTLNGRQGSYSAEMGDITVEGGVTVLSQGYTMLTDSLTYSPKLRTVNTKARIRLSSPRMDVTGVGMIIETDTENIRVLKDVRAVLKDAVI